MTFGMMIGGVPVVCIWFVIFLYAGSSALLAVWVASDTRKRAANRVLWIFVVGYFNVIGLLLYGLFRPGGRLAWCPRCNKQVLATLNRCPHCAYRPPRLARVDTGATSGSGA